VDADVEELGPVEVSPAEIRLVAYEDLVAGPARLPAAHERTRKLF